MKLFAFIVLFVGAAMPAVAQEGVSLPGGASSLTETHGTWVVSCRLVDGRKDCMFSQTAANSQTGQTVVAIELAVVGQRAEGMLLTAFGLRLDAGIQLSIDGQQLGSAQRFLTCMATGCLVPLDLDEISLTALRVGGMLEVTGINARSGEAVTVPLSLQGFTAALSRTAELSK